MAQLPFAAHGDTLPVVKISTKYEGSGAARHEVGVQFNALLLFDNCAQVPITIPGLDISKFPSTEVVTQRNQKLQFLVAKFYNLVVTFSGAEYGRINYRGTATGVDFLNLNPAPAQSAPSK